MRRQTGGGAILHDQELTYSLALPLDYPLVADDSHGLYPLAHEAVTEALNALDLDAARCGFTDDSSPTRGPFFCFERRHEYDLLVGGGKITASAQRRTRTALLQHGSIILGNKIGVAGFSFEFGGFVGDRNALALHYAWALSAGNFVRGDCNDDGSSNLADAIFLLGAQFPPPGTQPNVMTCEDACDVSDDGMLNLADAIVLLGSLFGTPPVPLAPPAFCGSDPTGGDPIGCVSFTSCP